ncbi:hypothetical protein Tco_0480237, partial [Tanacetum coccineum]
YPVFLLLVEVSNLRQKVMKMKMSLCITIIDNTIIQFGREEFCLVTGLRFGVKNLADYDDVELPIPFRRRVFSSYLDGEHITGNMVFKIIDDELFDRLHDDDAVSLCCLGILQLVLLGVEGKRRIPDWMLSLGILESFRVTEDRYLSIVYQSISRVVLGIERDKFLGSMGNLPAERLTPDETEARSDWWISSRAYFDGRIGVAEQGVPSPFQTHPNSSSFFNIGTPTHWQTPRPSQHGSSNWQAQMSAQVGPSNWQSHMPVQSATPYWQPAFPSHPSTYNPNLQPSIERHHDAAGLFNQNILNRGKREQRPSFYKRSPYMEQPATTVLPKQRGNKNKNNVKKANLSPLNLWSALDDENEGGDDVVYLGGRFTGNYLVYENVDPEKVKRENYVTYT